MKTAVTMLGEAFRQWQKDWDSYDKGIGDKPKSYDEFISPFIELEKEQIVKAWEDGDYAYFYSKETGRDFDNGEEYYKDVYNTKEVNDDKYSIFDCYGMIVEHYGINMTFEKAKNLIDKLNPIGDGFAPYTIEKTTKTNNL
jgi:hypothetical protein